MIQIGTHTLRNRVALAPMSGLSDAPFRQLVWELGAGYVVSEMVSGRLDLWDTEKSRRRREQVPGVSPVVMQLAGSEPLKLAETARRHVGEGVDIIDLNFGCPAKKVCSKAAGSALLNDEQLMSSIIAAVVAAVPVPVTVKTRTGWSPAERKPVTIARLVEDAGAAALVLHGRTRACRFKGAAEYDSVAAAKAEIRVPVFANGDIDTASKAHDVISRTGVDGVMIGRAAVGAPWLLAVINGAPEPGLAEKLRIMRRHLEFMHVFYGHYLGVRVARKHFSNYLKNLSLGSLVGCFNRIESAEQQLDWLDAQSEFLKLQLA